MSKKKSFAIFGLGRYGRAIAEELVAHGADVIAIDKDENIVEEASLGLPVCKCADITDSAVIEQLGIANMDVVVIAIASSLDASIMATLLCKEAGVPMVIAKCGSFMHQKILQKIGADKIVFPEAESGARLAKNLLTSNFVDMMELSDKVSIAELEVKKEWLGKNLAELHLRSDYSLNVVAIKKDDNVETEIDPLLPLTKDMKLIVVIKTSKLSSLA